MITDLRILIAQVADLMAEAVAPRRDRIPVDAFAEQPLGEYPDVPAGVAAAANPRQQDSTGGHPIGQSLLDLPLVTGIADQHTRRLDLRSGNWVCGCSQTFALPTEWVTHVLDLVEGELIDRYIAT